MMPKVAILEVLSFLFCLFAQAQGTASEPPKGEASSFSPAFASAAVTNSMEALDTKRELTVGDRVSYRVVEERSEARPLVVTDSGELEVPLIGRFKAAGKSCYKLAKEIKLELEKEYFYRATVIVGLDSVTQKSRGYIYVTGAVHNQGAIEIPQVGAFTVSKAIMRAGGFSDFANRKNVRLIRKGKDATPVDVKALFEGAASEDPVLNSDDVIIVLENRVNF
ncbi:MAG: polysaccharide biosynthesis/export family protein [Chthoniobacteraceae bacterium]